MAIAAHLEESRKSSRKSREPRRRILLEAQGAFPSGVAAQVTVHNISATGLLIECKKPLAIGERLAIDLPDAEVQVAEVVWESGRLYGCRFETPVSRAVLSAAELRSAVGHEVDTSAHQDGMSAESFGARLHRLRKERGLTMAQIATELDVSKPTVWAWERGRARPVEARLEALARVLGVSGSELLSGRDDSALEELLRKSREQIATAFGTGPDNVRIMIEL